MKREIKFRIFRPAIGEMQMVTQIMWGNLLSHGDISFISTDQNDVDPDKVHLMQFTGLHDKNGKEIYEGDIVEFKKKSGFGTDKGDKKVIVWDTVHLCFIMVWLQYFQTDVEYRNGNPITKTIGGYTYDKVTDSKKVEVIGNIYENPELLKPSTHE